MTEHIYLLDGCDENIIHYNQMVSVLVADDIMNGVFPHSDKYVSELEKIIEDNDSFFPIDFLLDEDAFEYIYFDSYEHDGIEIFMTFNVKYEKFFASFKDVVFSDDFISKYEPLSKSLTAILEDIGMFEFEENEFDLFKEYLEVKFFFYEQFFITQLIYAVHNFEEILNKIKELLEQYGYTEKATPIE